MSYVFAFLLIYYVHWMGHCHQIVDSIAVHCTVILFHYLHPITKQELMTQSTFHWYFAFFHFRYYVVLQVFWIGNLLRFDQRAITCSLEWQQPYVHQVGVQVFWSGNKCSRIAAGRHELQLCSFVCTYYRVGQRHRSVECHFCPQVIIYWSLSFSHNQLVQDL
jgi:hypothetical protein